jgi:hypothetical protein
LTFPTTLKWAIASWPIAGRHQPQRTLRREHSRVWARPQLGSWPIRFGPVSQLRGSNDGLDHPASHGLVLGGDRRGRVSRTGSSTSGLGPLATDHASGGPSAVGTPLLGPHCPQIRDREKRNIARAGKKVRGTTTATSLCGLKGISAARRKKVIRSQLRLACAAARLPRHRRLGKAEDANLSPAP